MRCNAPEACECSCGASNTTNHLMEGSVQCCCLSLDDYIAMGYKGNKGIIVIVTGVIKARQPVEAVLETVHWANTATDEREI